MLVVQMHQGDLPQLRGWGHSDFGSPSSITCKYLFSKVLGAFQQMFIHLTKGPTEVTIVTLHRIHMTCFCSVGRWQEEFQMSPNEHGNLKKNKEREMSFFMITLGVDLNPGYVSEPYGEPVRILMCLSLLLNLLLQEQD